MIECIFNNTIYYFFLIFQYFESIPLQIIIMLAKIKNFATEYKKPILATVSFLTAGYFMLNYFETVQIKMSSFLDALNSGTVENVMIEGQRISFSLNSSDWYQTVLGNFPIEQLYDILTKKNINFQSKDTILSPELMAIGATCILSVGTFKYMMGQINKSTITPADFKSSIYKTDHSFDDYYGGETIKEKFREVIDFLHQPEKYESMGARIRRGVLFYGPPGTGKTMLARALASEAGCSFIKVVASEFQEIFVGVGPKRIRQLFQSARKCPNGCIIFIDQIDALGSRLNHLRDSHETTTTINQFLSEMDGFHPNEKVLIVAATNRIDLVDHAILRAGRFDVKIFIPPPNVEQRKGIFRKIISKKVKQFTTVDEQTVDYIAKNSENWCGADIQTLVNEAIYIAIRDNKQYVKSQHIRAAFQQLVAKK